MSIIPSNQLLFEFERIIETTKTHKMKRQTSKKGKFRVIGRSVAQPTSTIKGVTNKEICVADPTATKLFRIFWMELVSIVYY